MLQVLYEIAYAYGSISTPFSMYTMLPRMRIPQDGVVSDVSGVSTGLVVEEDESAPDPLNFLSETIPQRAEVCSVLFSCQVMHDYIASSPGPPIFQHATLKNWVRVAYMTIMYNAAE